MCMWCTCVLCARVWWCVCVVCVCVCVHIVNGHTTVTVSCFGGCTYTITIRGTPNSLNYCVIFIESTEFTNVAAVRIPQSGGRGDGHL